MTAIRTASIAAALLAGGLFAAACGGPQPGHRQPIRVDLGLAYSSCVRAHGVPNFPDPAYGANGHVSINLIGIDPNSPQVRSAEHACQSVEPGGSAGSPPLTAAQQHAYLRWARCIQAHGVPDFPEPTFPGGQVQINVPADVKSNGSLRGAVPACAHIAPGGSPIEFGPGR